VGLRVGEGRGRVMKEEFKDLEGRSFDKLYEVAKSRYQTAGSFLKAARKGQNPAKSRSQSKHDISIPIATPQSNQTAQI
jgi:hypothetical protein